MHVYDNYPSFVSKTPLRSNMQPLSKSKSNENHSHKKRQLIEDLHAPARRHVPRRRVIVHGYDDLWQADIVGMRPYSRFNQGHHYILTVIDVPEQVCVGVTAQD